MKATAAQTPLVEGFGLWLAAQAPKEFRDQARDAGRLLAAAAQRGHTCVALSGLDEAVRSEAGWPAAGDPQDPLPAVQDALNADGLGELVGAGQPLTPLIRSGDRLYLRRLWWAEQQLADLLARMLGAPLPSVDTATLARALDALFEADGPGVGTQRSAAAAAVEHRLAVITGGPGTGKTWTLARALQAIRRCDPTANRILLAAPTGKAASRMAASLAQADIRDVEPATTVHRLLGYRPHDDSFRHSKDHPLPCDVLIVDEVSMVELPLLEQLLGAVPETARVVLLGDPDQLASVGIGQVLGDLRRLTEDASAPSPWRASMVHLEHSRRFDPSRGIGALARACRDGDGVGLAAVLADTNQQEVRHHPAGAPLDVPAVADGLSRWLEDRERDPSAVLTGLSRWQILCALRAGPRGVEGITSGIHHRLQRGGIGAAGRTQRLHGMPILITANDPDRELSNGDVGVLWCTEGAATVDHGPVAENSGTRWLGCFANADGSIREIPAAMLPAWEPAWALTVHKSQGSEYDAVTVVMPEGPHPLATRELLYTALTRARQRVHLVGTAEDLMAAVAQQQLRGSGLVDAMRARQSG